MTFKYLKNETFQINRFCSKENYNNLEKLCIEYFKRKYSWKEIIKYIDLRWENENKYLNLNFKLEKQIESKHWFFQRDILKRFDFIDHNVENYLKIYDCGYLKLKLKK
jgi:hypothetical protein